jgi:hypothetical protein
MTRFASSAATFGALIGLSLGVGGCVVAPPVDDAYYGPPPVASYAPPRPVVVAPPTVAVYPRTYTEDRVVVRPSYRYDRDRHRRWYRDRDRRWDRDRHRDHDHDYDYDHDGR